MGQTPRHSVSVAAVIFNATDTHVLLIQRRDNGRWEPPGGVLELDETIEDGLRREVREEAGVEIEVEALSGVYKNMRHGIVAMVYRCRATNEPDEHSDEATAVAWQPLDHINDLMKPAYSVRVRDAVPGHPAATRAHDGVELLDEDRATGGASALRRRG